MVPDGPIPVQVEISWYRFWYREARQLCNLSLNVISFELTGTIHISLYSSLCYLL